jgi:hypothetical protein
MRLSPFTVMQSYKSCSISLTSSSDLLVLELSFIEAFVHSFEFSDFLSCEVPPLLISHGKEK